MYDETAAHTHSVTAHTLKVPSTLQQILSFQSYAACGGFIRVSELIAKVGSEGIERL